MKISKDIPETILWQGLGREQELEAERAAQARKARAKAEASAKAKASSTGRGFFVEARWNAYLRGYSYDVCIYARVSLASLLLVGFAPTSSMYINSMYLCRTSFEPMSHPALRLLF